MEVLVLWVLVPVSLAAVAASGWYVATGDTPLDLIAQVMLADRIDEPMPPRPGPEKPEASLIQPPAAPTTGQPAAQMSPQAPVEPQPAAEVRLPAAPQAPTDKAPTDKAPPGKAPPDKAPEEKAPNSKAPTDTHLPAAPEAPSDVRLPATPVAGGEPAATTAATTAGSKPEPATEAKAAPPPPPPGSDPQVPAAGDPPPQPSFAQLPARDNGPPLPPAPRPEMLRNTANGALPIIAGGDEPRTAYARPFTAETKAGKVAVVVTGLGLSKDATAAAIAKLPPEVSLSFSPYAGNLDAQIKKARAAGHEVLLDLPLEPANFPLRDAGPLSILARHAASEAVDHLEAVLGKANSYVGVAAFLHSPVTASETWQPTLQDLKNRGLLFLGDGLVGVPDNFVPAAASVTLVADEVPFRTAIDARLTRLTMAAERDGVAVAYVSAKPVTFERLLAWVATLASHNLVLAPVSAIVKPGA